jgi:peptidoglycan/xylan/chitin deacetylase (PgdA/CDA1 family)
MFRSILANLTLAKRAGLLRRLVRHAWIVLLYCTGMLWWAKYRIRQRGAITVLTFHRVLDEAAYRSTNSVRGMVMRARTFQSLCAYVARHCDAVAVLDSAHAMPGSGKLRVAFTFDDGWADTATTAFPIAQQFRIPIAVFVCPSLLGQHSPFWPERAVGFLKLSKPANEVDEALESLKQADPRARQEMLTELARTAGLEVPPDGQCDSMMDWHQTHTLREAGVTFGSHSDTHPILTQASSEEVRLELSRSKEQIEQELHGPCVVLAYPNGNCSPEICKLASNCGFRYAFTTRPGIWTEDGDPLRVPRMNVWEGTAVSITGSFSRLVFEYSVFWQAYVAAQNN